MEKVCGALVLKEHISLLILTSATRTSDHAESNRAAPVYRQAAVMSHDCSQPASIPISS